MRRRTFLAGVLGSAALPLAVQAQRSGKPPTIGYIGANTEAIDRPRVDAFMKRLAGLGWQEGGNIALDARWTQGVVARAEEIASEFVRLGVDLILTTGDAQVIAAKKATDKIPIIFAAVGDPVGNGLVKSLAYPGGNATGLSIQLTDSVGKRIDLLRDLLPDLRRLGLIGNFANPTVALEMSAAQSEARAIAIETIPSGFARTEEVAPAIARLKGRVEAIYVCQDPLVGSSVAEINAAARDARLPTMFSVRDFVARGGVMSYGPNYLALYRRAAEMTDAVLRGVKPSDIPVEQPTQFDLVVNLKTAKALGLEVPDALVGRADEVIE